MEFSSSLMDDAPLMESFALDWLAKSLTYGLETVGINGNGAAKPMGALTQSGTANGFGETNVGNPVTATGLMDGRRVAVAISGRRRLPLQRYDRLGANYEVARRG